jgi:lipopolysaccharide transport system permease protein
LISAIWQYRFFIFSAVKNDFKNRLSRSKLGFIWLMVQPLAMAFIYALILSKLINAKLPNTDSVYAYPIYLLAGILAWTVFSETLSRSLTMFMEHANLMKKMAIPKVVIPLIVLGIAFVQSMFLLLAILLVVISIGHPPSWNWLWIPLLMLLTIGVAFSLGLILGTLNVFYRDIGQLVPILLQLGFWLTPIVYTVHILPEAFQPWFAYNPMTHLVAPFQQVLLYGTMPNLVALLWMSLVVLILSFISLRIFKRAAPELVDEL